MELKLAENIRIFRKSKKMTQEQLAEALGITVGAVSKWESSATTPEISMIMEIAEFFDISVDVLLGYHLQSGTLEQLLAQIKTLREERSYDEAIRIGEKALQKFPNNFDVVYQTALCCFCKGSTGVDKATTKRAQELFRHALELIGQNTDPEISPWLIKNQLGESYLYLREAEKAVEIFRENNFNGINDSRIAQALSDILKRHNEALPYAKRAFRKMVEDMVEVMVALGTIHYGNKNNKSADECLSWIINALESLEPDDHFCETTLMRINLIQAYGEILYARGQRERAKEYISQARRLAKAYDAAPLEEVATCRFFEGRLEGRSFLNQHIESALSYMEYRLHWQTREEAPDYYALWEEVAREVDGEE